MRVLLSWSSGKDAAWALHTLRARGVPVSGLLTTADERAGRVPVHDVPLGLVQAQSEALGLPLRTVPLPWPCPDATYRARFAQALHAAREAGTTHVAFGDLLLEDVRAWREALVRAAGLEPLFPLWAPPGGTAALARAMLRAGLRATVAAADARLFGSEAAGAAYDAAFLEALPSGCDPCGEYGEFHTFAQGGPPFDRPLRVRTQPAVLQSGFWLARPVPDSSSDPS
ncbi:MAG: ATP-binding protein [Rubricoccaceae bacterium]